MKATALLMAGYPQPASAKDRLDRQLTLNESVTCSSVLLTTSEGRPRANESGPLTIPAPQNRREVDASMHTCPGAARPASTSSQQAPPTEPVRLRDCFVDLLAELAEREGD